MSRGPRRARLISYALLATAIFIGYFNRFSPATFADLIAENLGLSTAAVGSLAAIHFWVYTLMQVPAGLVVDRFGVCLPAVLGTLLTGVGALILGVTENYVVALSGPFLVGVGMALVFVAAMKNNAIWFDSQEFGMVTGVTLLIGTFGSIVSEAPALFLLELIDWRTIFVTLGLITVATALLIFFFWRSPFEVGRQGTQPSVRPHGSQKQSLWLDVVRSRQLWLILLAIAGTNGTFYAFAGLWGTQLLRDGYGLPAASASLILTLALVPYGVGSPLLGQVSDWLKTRKSLIWVSSSLNLFAWLWLLLVPGNGFASGLVCFLVLGLSGGAQVAVAFAAVKESVHANLTGAAIAFVNMGVFLVTAVVQTAYGWMIASPAVGGTPGAIYRSALWLPAGLSLIGFVAALWVKETYSSSLDGGNLDARRDAIT